MLKKRKRNEMCKDIEETSVVDNIDHQNNQPKSKKRKIMHMTKADTSFI